MNCLLQLPMISNSNREMRNSVSLYYLDKWKRGADFDSMLGTHHNRPTCKLILSCSIRKFLYCSAFFLLACTLERLSSVKEVIVSIAVCSCYRCNERSDLWFTGRARVMALRRWHCGENNRMSIALVLCVLPRSEGLYCSQQWWLLVFRYYVALWTPVLFSSKIQGLSDFTNLQSFIFPFCTSVLIIHPINIADTLSYK